MHIVVDDAVPCMVKKLSSALIGTANGEIVKAKSGVSSAFHLYQIVEPVKLDLVLYVPNISLNLVFVAGLCKD